MKYELLKDGKTKMLARISWDGLSSNDQNLLYKSPTSITVTFGGINTNKYTLNTNRFL